MDTPQVYGAILCAGLGTRMRPITNRLPKPLIPFLNTPLIAYALNHLMRAGVATVGVNLHHLADAIPPVCKPLCKAFGMDAVFAREWELLGTAGGLRGIWEAHGAPATGTLAVLNSDVVMNLALADHLAAHQRSGARATLVVRSRAEGAPGGVWLDASGKLQGLRDMRAPGAPPDSLLREYTFTGAHLIEAGLLDEIPLAFGCMIGDVYGPRLVAGERFGVSIMDDFWMPLDSPELYMAATRRCLDEPGLFHQAPLPAPMRDGLFIYNPDTLHNKLQLAAPALLGVSVQAEGGAMIGPYAVVDGAELATGVIVKNAVIYGMGRVEGEWSDCVAIAGAVATLSAPAAPQE